MKGTAERGTMAWALVCIGLAACGGQEDGPGAFSEVRDSTGVTIVENGALTPGAPTLWEVSAEPIVTIGSVDGPETQQLYQVEGAHETADGGILVANGGTSEIRVYDAEGAWVRSWGGEGEGPGEFAFLADLFGWVADSVAVYDQQLGRITFFDREGRVGRTISTQVEGVGSVYPLDVTDDGRMLVAALTTFTGGEAESGLERRDRRYALIDGGGALVTDFGPQPGTEYVVVAGERFMSVRPHPFARSSHSVAWADGIVLAADDEYELRVYEPGGELRTILRRDHEVVPVTRADLDAALERELADMDEVQRAARAEADAALPLVETLPAYADVLVDGEGWLWVREYSMPGDERRVWCVYDPGGRIQGRVETPAGARILEVGRDHVVGLTTDDLDVEYVRIWALSRGGG